LSQNFKDPKFLSEWEVLITNNTKKSLVELRILMVVYGCRHDWNF